MKNDKNKPEAIKPLGRVAAVIMPSVKAALETFAAQEPEFAQATAQSDKTIQECCEEIVKNCGIALSDLEVYSRAVKFYFSTATVHFDMRIDLCGGNGYTAPPITHTVNPVSTEPEEKPTSSSMVLSLDELLDF